MTVHASAFVIGRHGVLVRGASGAGKSLLVEECLRRAASVDLFSVWVADDRVELTRRSNGLIASAVGPIAGKRELRFSGIADVAHIRRCRLDLVVDMVPGANLDRLPAAEEKACPGPGAAATVALPLCRVPVENLDHACHILMQALRTI